MNFNQKVRELALRLISNNNTVIASGEPKVYVASLTQIGTDAPVATILKNTLGGVPVYTYNNVGAYTCTLIDAFPTGKTNIETSTIYWLDTAIEDLNKFVKVTKFTEDYYTIISSLDGVHENDILNNFYLKIEVYP